MVTLESPSVLPLPPIGLSTAASGSRTTGATLAAKMAVAPAARATAVASSASTRIERVWRVIDSPVSGYERPTLTAETRRAPRVALDRGDGEAGTVQTQERH